MATKGTVESATVTEARREHGKAAAMLRAAAAELAAVERRLRRAAKTAEAVAVDPEDGRPYTVEGWIADLLRDCDLPDLREIASRLAKGARHNWRRAVENEAQRAAREHARSETNKAHAQELAAKIRAADREGAGASGPRAEFRAFTESLLPLRGASLRGVERLGFTVEELVELRGECAPGT